MIRRKFASARPPRETEVARGGRADRGQPAVDERLLVVVARGHAAQAPHRGERAQLQEAEQARCLHVHPDVQLVGEPAARRPAGQPLREPRR